MESYQETVLSAMKLSFFLIGSEIGEIPAGAQHLIYTVSYLESLLIAASPVRGAARSRTRRRIGAANLLRNR